MAQHGSLGEGDGVHGDYESEREEARERRWRERDEGRRESDEFGREQRPGFMFEDEERERPRGRMSHYGPEHGYGGFQGDYSRSGRQQGGFGGYGDYREGRTSFTPNRDEQYLNWRQKQIDALDRDYEDYCREREQQFHQDFDTWRSNRGQQSGELLLDENAQAASPAEEIQAEVDPQSTATLGTVPGRTGRRRR